MACVHWPVAWPRDPLFNMSASLPTTNPSAPSASWWRDPLVWWSVVGVLSALVLAFLGLLVGTTDLGTSWHWLMEGDSQAQLVLWDIRLPRSVGAWCAGALLALAGAMAQGLFRNPLADPYLLGSASGAALAVAVVLAGGEVSVATLAWTGRLELTSAAFVGACGAMALTLLLARGTLQTQALLLSGIVVAFVLGAMTSMLMLVSVDAWRAMQSFLLGNTGFLGWSATGFLALACGVCLAPGLWLARGLDALTLGEDTAQSLGLSLRWLRLAYLGLVCLATATAVAQVGVVSFVGLVAPHLVRQTGPMNHRRLLWCSMLCGGALLQIADVLSRYLISPAELPVGALTACLGGMYLLLLMWRRGSHE